jgi:hypothetical protein
MTRLLIIACSARKHLAKGRLPAIGRYDGPAFRVLRKYLREAERPALTVLILSAKYGLLPAGKMIPNYDSRISATTARRIQTRVLATLLAVLNSQQWRVIGVCAGRPYQAALVGISELLPPGVSLNCLSGGLGPRLTALKKWLLEA